MRPCNPTQTTGATLREFAKKINEGNKLGICSLLLVAGLAVTLAVMSQDISKEKATEIEVDFKNTKIGMKKILLKPTLDEVGHENQAAWQYVKSFAIETNETHIRTMGLIHSVDTGEANPHAVVSIIQNSPLPTMMIIPKGICTDEGWGIILKAKPNPEFGTKWGYKIPDALGMGTKPGSERAIEEAPKPEAVTATTQPTMPVERTITNTKGVAIEGTILSKTDTVISFQRKDNGKTIDIKLDLLSAEDQAFIATLVTKTAGKPTVLFLVNQDFPETDEVRTWLTDNGFDVKIGIIKAGGYGAESYKVPKGVDFVTVAPPEIVDQFDILWINRFDTKEEKGHEAWSHFSLAGRRNQQQRLVVIPTHSKLDRRDRFLSSENYYAGSPKIGDEEKAYVKVDKNFIFCSSDKPFDTDEKMREKLLAAIKTQLAK